LWALLPTAGIANADAITGEVVRACAGMPDRPLPSLLGAGDLLPPQRPKIPGSCGVASIDLMFIWSYIYALAGAMP